MRLKRVISAALAVSMAVSMMPATAVSAFAEGTSTNTAETTTVTGENSTESEAETSGPCGRTKTNTLKWAFDSSTGVLAISGAGDMQDYTDGAPTPWKSFADEITEIQIGDQVTGIGTAAFAGLKKLKKVNIPASITRLGSYIFNNDEELVTVDWAPDFRAPSVQDTDLLKYNADHLTHEGTFVPTGMFDHCYKLGEGQELSAWLGGRFTGICCAAFRGTKFTVDFDQLNNMDYWGPYAFASMDNLDSVTLTNGPTIGKLGGLARTFAGSGLKKMVVHATNVPAWIAENCEKLETVEFGNEVTTIETYAFCNTGITELNVPETANGITIDRAAFINNKNLKNVTLHGNVTLKGAAFTGCGIENFTVAEGANVLGTANPFSEWANKTETIASAVTSVKNVTIMGTLEADPTSVSGNVTPEQQTTGLWGQMFHEQTGIDEITVNGANLQYIQGNTFPNLRKMYVVGGDAVPVGYTYSGKPLESVDIDVSTYTSSHHGAFFDAQQLKTVTIKANSVTLGQNDFQLCPELKAVDLSQCGSVTYNNNTFGMGVHHDYQNSAPTNKDVYIYVKDDEANPRNSSTNTGIEGNGIVMVIGDGAIVDMTKTGFDSVTKAGCTAKWYENADSTGEAVTTPEIGKTYYAKWEKNQYTVTFNNNGHDKKPADKTVEYGDRVKNLPKLSDSTNEWVFDGWYMDENFKTQYDNQAITGNTTLYAKWHEYQNTALTAKVSKSDYLVNTPADVNVTVTPGDDFGELMRDMDNIKISLTYDDDVTSVMLNGKVLDKKEYTISELMPLMGQNRKLDVTYGKAGTHTFGIALKNGNKIVSECGTNIVVAEEAAELTPATKLYTLTVKNANVTIKNGDEEIKAEKNGKGELIAKVPEKADVTVTYTSQSDAVAFDQWTITTDETLDVDVKNNPLKFQMPAGGVTIEAMTKDASIEEDEPNILGTAAVVGTAAAGTAILAWQGYQLGTELYLKTALPAGTAIPTNRAELALLVWNHAGKPAPAAVLPADATDTQKAIAWAVENDLLKAAKDNGETYVDTDSVSRVEVIRVWNKAQEK